MKFTLSCIVICIHLCLARHTGTNKNGLRIRGGRNATEDEFPYVVKLMLSMTTRKPVFFCTGVVLTSKWTLTAGHCVVDAGQRLQQLLRTGVTQTKAVIEYQPSPKADVAYSEVTSMSKPPGREDAQRILLRTPLRNDIGLLHTQPVLLAKYGKLSPIDYAALKGQEVSIVGYGRIMNMDEEPPLVPRVIDVAVKECTEYLFYPQLCFAPSCSARMPFSQTACPGDSGGPAVHASGVVAVVSGGNNRECFPKIPLPFIVSVRYDMGYEAGTGTPISPFIDWISTVMRTEIDTRF